MVRVNTFDGLLEGEVLRNEYGGSFYSFKGIPYAKPPLGDLRFMAPQPVEPWNDVRDAKREGPICIQFEDFLFNRYFGREDCLYLNVYTPNLTPIVPLPVMIWIHGGGFYCGSGAHAAYGPEFLIKKDVILVTFNYRLEAIGFLCLDTEDIPGNAGMKDQVAVLRWVQKNIQNFGGDPKNVTIFGQSAGGASVSFHLISPMSAGLFKRAILQSGAVTNWWAKCRKPRDRAIALARRLGCFSEDDKELSKFFKSVPIELLVKIKLPVTISESIKTKLDVISFAVVDEKQFSNKDRFFFESDNENTISRVHKNVEIMIGYNEHEGIVCINHNFNINDMLDQANNFAEYFVPNSIIYKTPISDQIEVGQKIKKYYFGNDTISMNNIKQFVNFMTTDMFAYGLITFARMVAKNSHDKVFLYKFTCKTKRNIFTEIYGAKKMLEHKIFVAHADELLYIFPMTGASETVDENSNEYRKIQTVTQLWTNFAKYGNPTPDDDLDVKWLPFTIERENYLDIGSKLTVHNHPEKDEIKFWDTIYAPYSFCY